MIAIIISATNILLTLSLVFFSFRLGCDVTNDFRDDLETHHDH